MPGEFLQCIFGTCCRKTLIKITEKWCNARQQARGRLCHWIDDCCKLNTKKTRTNQNRISLFQKLTIFFPPFLFFSFSFHYKITFSSQNIFVFCLFSFGLNFHNFFLLFFILNSDKIKSQSKKKHCPTLAFYLWTGEKWKRNTMTFKKARNLCHLCLSSVSFFLSRFLFCFVFLFIFFLTLVKDKSIIEKTSSLANMKEEIEKERERKNWKKERKKEQWRKKDHNHNVFLRHNGD